MPRKARTPGQGSGESPTSPRRVDTALRRHQALIMRRDGATYDQIAKALGYASKDAANMAVRRALAITVQEPADEVRALELQRLDMMWMTVIKVLRDHHVVVSQGRVVFLGDEPIRDVGPILAAIDRLLKIQERRAKYLGLDAATRLQVVTIDEIDAQIRALNEELERAAHAAEPGGEEAEDEAGDVADGAETTPAY